MAITTWFCWYQSKAVMQRYNYPLLIWMKQNISFACSNYQSHWQLLDSFCFHLSELNHIENRRKRIVNQIVTIEKTRGPRYTVNSVNRFTSVSCPPVNLPNRWMVTVFGIRIKNFTGDKSWTFIHQDLWYGKLVPSSHHRGNIATPSSAPSAEETIKSGRAFQSLIVWGKDEPCKCQFLQQGLKSYWMIISTVLTVGVLAAAPLRPL